MPDAATNPPMPRWKRALFLTITLLLPVAALGVVEGALRLFGWGGYPAFIRQVGEFALAKPVAR